jgi:hypothetical protein
MSDLGAFQSAMIRECRHPSGESEVEESARQAHEQAKDLEQMKRERDERTASESPLTKATRVWDGVADCTCGQIFTEGRRRRVSNPKCPMHKGI